MIDRFPIEYEPKPGAAYGEVEGGVHYKNLELISEPLAQHLRVSCSGKARCADFGGGSGIVGLHTKRSLGCLGFDTSLDVIDINPAQLEGVEFEAAKHGYNGNIGRIKADLCELGMAATYDCGTMRMVLNYMTKEQIPIALRNVAMALKHGAVFVNCAMAAFDVEQQIFYNNHRYPSSDRTIFGSDRAQRYIPMLSELMAMQSSAFGNCFVSGYIKMNQTSRNVQDRFSLSDAQAGAMAAEWFMAPDKAKKELRLFMDDMGITHYDWWNVVLSSMKV